MLLDPLSVPPPPLPAPIRRGQPCAGRGAGRGGLAGVGFLASVVLAGLVVAAGPASAQRGSDRTRPLTVEADTARYDDARQTGRFAGNVVVTQGTLVLRAAEVEVRQAGDGTAAAVATGTAAEPARFRQKREGLDEVLEGEALRIEYDGRADTLRFVDAAVLRRWRGGVLADEASGGVITFDNAASVYSVVGGAPGTGGRVRAVITPRAATPAPPAAQPGAR